MPKKAVITEEIIIDAAFSVIRAEGFQSLSARNVAKKLGCSTQPIYWVFRSMDDLKRALLTKMVVLLRGRVLSFRKTGYPLFDLGLGYINVARTEPVLFQAIYVDNVLNQKRNLVVDPAVVQAMKSDPNFAAFPPEEHIDIATRTWLVVHGISCLVASGVVDYNEEEMQRLLTPLYLHASLR